MTGYLDSQGVGSEKIAILRARQIVPVVNGAVTYYTVIFSILDMPAWDLGSQRVLNLSVGDPSGRYTGQLPVKLMF